jgi:hypothetical protein
MVTKSIGKLAVIALFSFLGGIFSNWLSSGQVAAQNQVDTYADSVTAKIFRLVDKSGKLRGVLGFEETGSPVLVFKDANEKNRFLITSHSSGSTLVFQDDKERMRVGLDLNESGEFSLIYFDEKKTHRASLIVNSTDGPKFGFMDDHGKIRLGMQLYQNNQPMLFLGNEQEKQEILLSLDKNFGPGLYLHDKVGRPLTAFTPQGQVIPEQAGMPQKTTR